MLLLIFSARYGHWHKDKGQQLIKNVPRVIVFVIGGVSFSEIRCAYEVTSNFKNWEVIIGKVFLLLFSSIFIFYIYVVIFIGSSHVLTPEDFLNNLSALSQ